MIYILIFTFIFFSILLITNPLFRKKRIISKIIIYIIFTLVIFLITVLFIMYLWNTNIDYREQKKMMNSHNIYILNTLNNPIKNTITILENKNNKDTIISNTNGFVNYNKVKNKTIIIQAKGHLTKTIAVNKINNDTIRLKQIQTNNHLHNK